MKCPYCGGGVVEFEPYVGYNVEAYGKTVIGRTACCGKGLKVGRVITLKIGTLSEYEQTDTDDWGVPIKQ